jgi:hypothetical protein
MDLLFTMCDTSCAEELVGEMLRYLQVHKPGMALSNVFASDKYAQVLQE